MGSKKAVAELHKITGGVPSPPAINSTALKVSCISMRDIHTSGRSGSEDKA